MSTGWKGGPPEVALVERLASEAIGSPVEVVGLDRIEPWCLARAHLQGAGAPATAMVKWLRSFPSGYRSDRVQMVIERVSLEWLESLGLALAPLLIAADEAADVLMFEDLSPRRVLWDLLRMADPAAQIGLGAFAQSLAWLHRESAGRAVEFYAVLGRHVAVDAVVERRRVIGSPWSWELPDLDPIEVTPTAAAVREMTVVRAAILEPGPFLALSNGDAGANNFMVDGADGRLIDWEFGCFRHALIDAACLHVPGPMWSTVADPGRTGIADVYRATLAEGISAAESDEFERGLAGACLANAAERLGRLQVLDERPPGHHSRAKMVSTVESAARAMRACGSPFPDLLGWLDDAAVALRRRWPDTDHDYSDAYTPRE